MTDYNPGDPPQPITFRNDGTACPDCWRGIHPGQPGKCRTCGGTGHLPITFRDEEGRECCLRVHRGHTGKHGEFWMEETGRNATPDDLARAGYVQADQYNALLHRAGFVTSGAELEALRALAEHVRASSGKVTYPLRRELAALLKAIDEARE